MGDNIRDGAESTRNTGLMLLVKKIEKETALVRKTKVMYDRMILLQH